MKSRLFGAVAALGLALAAGAGSAWAVIPSGMHIKVPFDFVVGNTTMPAGEYTIKNPDLAAQNVIEIRSENGHKAVLVQTEPASLKSTKFSEQNKLEFRKINGKEYLACVWAAGTNVGDEIHLPAAR